MVLVLVLGGCASTAALGERDTLDRLRERARASPASAPLQARLALAESFADGGDTTRAPEQLARALKFHDSNPSLWFVAGLLHDMHGEPSQALDAYLEALQHGAGHDEPLGAHISELAVLAIHGVRGAVDEYDERVAAVVGDVRERLVWPARYRAVQLLQELRYRRGDREAVDALAERQGCVTSARVAGPFGPRDLLGFDREPRVAVDRPLADAYELGPTRGRRATRSVLARGCRLNLGGGPVAEGGLSVVQSELVVAEPGMHVLRIESPNSFEVYLGERRLARVDRRARPTANVHWITEKLGEGSHRLTVRLASRHPSPTLSVAFGPADKRDERAIRDRAIDARGDAMRVGFARYLSAALAYAQSDVVRAREVLRSHVDARRTPATLLVQRAQITMVDPLVPRTVREDRARQLLQASLARDPDLWSPTLQLAQLRARRGRVKEAIVALREARQRWPRVPAIGLTLVELLRKRGWHAEAERIVTRLRKQVPSACAPMQAARAGLLRRQRMSEAHELARRIVACDARSPALYRSWMRRRNWAKAEAELERLQAIEPQSDGYQDLFARVELARQRGDDQRLQELLRQLRTDYPRSDRALRESADRLLGQGAQDEAIALVEQGLASEPASLQELRWVRRALARRHELEPYRASSAEAIAAFERSGRSYDQPQILVFDYMVVRIFEDGSFLELVHTVQKVQSDEAVDQLGEVAVPDGARVLTLQTIKADGRRLEPDDIRGKDTVSLPALSVGDYVEFEYIQPGSTSNGFPGGFLGNRFYFRSFEVPFDVSELLVVLPSDMPFQIDPRGNAPQTEEQVEDGLRTLRWRVQASEPLVREPLSVAPREYIPSVNLAVGATWPRFVESLRDVLVDRDQYDPAIDELVDEIVDGASDPLERAQRIYAWVLKNIDHSNDTFSQAAVMLRARTGSRARILHYMLSLAGVPSKLALVRSYATDQTPSDVANSDTYEHLLVVLQYEGTPLWLWPVLRWAPFGYIPPLLRGQPALLLDDEASEARVADGSPGQDRRFSRFDISLQPDGAAHIEVVERFRGAGALAWRQRLEAVAPAELELRMEDEYVAHILPGATLASLQIGGLKHTDPYVELRYSFDVERLGRPAAEGWAIPTLAENELAATYAQLATRTTTELIASPVDSHIVTRLRLPAGARAPNPPPAVELRGPQGARFEQRAQLGDRVLRVERHLYLPRTRIPPARYPDFAAFCQKVDAVEQRETVLNTN